MSEYKLEAISHFAVNIADLTQLSPIELLLVQDKIESHSIITISKSQLDGQAVLLRSTLNNDCSLEFATKQKRQLLATCQLLAERCQARTYYSTNGKTFQLFKFNGNIKEKEGYHA